MQPDDAAHLWDMREASQRLSSLMHGIDRQRFDDDEFVQLSVERLLQNIGEAARRVSQQFRVEHPDIPWVQIVAQRNVLVHEYGVVRPELIWLAATEDVPALLRMLDPLVPQEPTD